MSLVEALIAVSTIGILAAIAVPTYSKVRENSVARVSSENQAWLNEAVDLYGFAVGIISNARDDESTDEEQGVIDLLTTTTRPAGVYSDIGFPFLKPTPTITETTDVSVPRYQWNGHHFEVIPAGTEGIGFVLFRVSEEEEEG